jgi:hypothetical protein
MRVLHLVDVHSSCSGPILHQAVRSCIDSMPEHDHVVFEIGGGERGTVLSERAVGRIPPLLKVRPLTGNAHPLTLFLDAQSPPVDMVQSWGQASTSLSATCCSGLHRVAMLDAFSLTPGFAQELRVASDMVLGCTVLGSARRLIESGVTATRVHHLPPVVQWPVADDRAAWRERWGACDDTIVLGVLDEPRGTAGLRQVAHVVSRLGLLGERVRLVVSPESARLEDTQRWLTVLGFPDTLVADEAVDRAWNVLDAIDVVVVGGGRDVEIAGSSGLSLARAAGRPILLGSGHPATEEELGSEDVFVECDRNEDTASAWVRSRWRSVDPVTDATPLVDGLRELYRVFDAEITPASANQADGAVS